MGPDGDVALDFALPDHPLGDPLPRNEVAQLDVLAGNGHMHIQSLLRQTHKN